MPKGRGHSVWRPKGRYVAVDYDSRRLRLVEVDYNRGQAKIARLYAMNMPGGVDLNDAQAVGEVLAEGLKSIGRKGAKLLMCVPRGKAVLKTITLPAGSEADEMPAMVQFQIGKELPFPQAEAVSDYIVETHFDPSGQTQTTRGLDVLTAAVKLPVVDHYRQVADAAGGKLARLGLRPHSNQGCVDRCVERGDDELVAVVNLTADEAEIDILRGDALAFTRSATVRLPEIEQGDDAHDEAIRGVVTEVVRSLTSYQAVHRGEQLSSILVAGDTGVESALVTQLHQQMNLPCEPLDPAGALGLEYQGDSSGFVAALGLAFRGEADQGEPFDFLNPKQPVEKSDPRKALAAAGIVLAMFLLIGGFWYAGRAKADRLAELRRVARQLDDAEELNERVRDLRATAEAVEDWQDNRPDWLGHLAMVTSLLPSAEQAYISDFQGDLARAGRDVRVEIEFTLRARSPESVEAIWRQLHAREEYELSPEAPEQGSSDPFGQAAFNTRGRFDMVAELAPEVEPERLVFPPRPAQDDSLRLMNQQQGGGQ